MTLPEETKRKKFFNTAGLCFPEDHYMVREQLPKDYWPGNPQSEKFLNLNLFLTAWSENQEKPIALFIDEIDALLDDVLISILRQLRDGYQGRPKHFPSSVALVGLRDIREYKAKIRDGYVSLGTASPFNVKAKSILMNNFSKDDTCALLEQHTLETGQVFSQEKKNYLCSNVQNGFIKLMAPKEV